MAYVWSAQVYLEETRARARATLELYTQGLEGRLRKFEVIPQLLARRGEVIALFRDTADPAVVARANRLTEEVNGTTGAQDTYFMDAEGMTFAASNWASERPFVGGNFAFRPYFRQAMQGELGRYFALGTTSQKRGFYFAYPVRENDAVLGAVVVKVNVDRIEQSWAGGQDDVIVSDKNGVIFISSRADWRFKTLRPLSQAAIRQISEDRQYELSDLTPLDIEWHSSADTAFDLVHIADGAARGARAPNVEYLVEARYVTEADWTVYALAGTYWARSQIRATVALSVLACLLVLLVITVVDQRRRRLVEGIELQKAAAERLEQRVRERTADLSATNTQLEREIKEREATEAALRRAQNELIQAGKLAALGQMSAAISHEFNQPLAAIRSYAESAVTLIGRGRHDEASGNCGRIRDLTGRMAAISKHLNAFARKPQGRLNAVPLDTVIEDTLEFVKGRLDAAGARVEVRLPDERLIVMAGTVRLQQVLTNLVVNALDAMAGTAAPKIELSVEKRDGHARIGVRDHGPGIAEDHLDQIFDPFFTTKEVGRGLGLGLSITYNIVKDFNGSLSVRNHEAGGALFTIDLPLAPAEVVGEAAE